jgi:hypothetical protein
MFQTAKSLLGDHPTWYRERGKILARRCECARVLRFITAVLDVTASGLQSSIFPSSIGLFAAFIRFGTTSILHVIPHPELRYNHRPHEESDSFTAIYLPGNIGN